MKYQTDEFPMNDEQLTVSPAAAQETPIAVLPGDEEPETLQAWLSHPTESFARWLATQKYEESSRKIYRSMWAKFSRWMKEGGYQLDSCSSQHISIFLDGAELYRAHRQRYVRLIERVYTHLFSLGLRIDNPGQEAGYAHVGAGLNDPMRCLDQEERSLLFTGLRSIWGAGQSSEEDQKEKTWALIRDAAMIGVITGGGAKISEVGQLTVNCSSEDGWLVIPPGKVDEHRAPLLPIGEEALAVWARVRAGLGFGGRVLFPADVSRRRDGLNGPFQTMHPATIYRRINALFKRFGIDQTRAITHDEGATLRNGGQTLRNTYAATLFERDEPDEVIAEALGLYADFSVPRLRDAHTKWLALQGRAAAAR